MKCVRCDKELALWEEPARGNPPVCDSCLRDSQARPDVARHSTDYDN